MQRIHTPESFWTASFAYSGRLGRREQYVVGDLVQRWHVYGYGEVDVERLTAQGRAVARRLTTKGYLRSYVDARGVECFQLATDRVFPCSILPV
jgi:hypothetical protein